MHWKTKARIQNLLAKLPSALSYEAYYQAQRWFGGLRNSRVSDFGRIDSAVSIWQLAQKCGGRPEGKVFFEVGTGRTVSIPVTYWLLGAESTITVDLNPYLKPEITHQALRQSIRDEAAFRSQLADQVVEERFVQLRNLLSKPFRLPELMEMCHIQYIAPGDAAATGLPDDSVDIHTSFTVYEHIPATVLEAITLEGNRIVRNDGLFIHGIDYSDHFAHSDSSISRINFLQYSQSEWDRLAGNRYMYMNRLRHDDYVELFERCGQKHLDASTIIDERSQRQLNAGEIHLDASFASKSRADLAARWGWHVLQKH